MRNLYLRMMYVILTRYSDVDVNAPAIRSAYVNLPDDKYDSTLIAVNTYVDISISWSESEYTPDSPSAGKGKATKAINASAKVVDAIVATTDGIEPGAVQPTFASVGKSDAPLEDDDDDSFAYLEDTEPRGSVVSHEASPLSDCDVSACLLLRYAECSIRTSKIPNLAMKAWCRYGEFCEVGYCDEFDIFS